MEFEPTISAGERPQTYALDRAATGTGKAVCTDTHTHTHTHTHTRTHTHTNKESITKPTKKRINQKLEQNSQSDYMRPEENTSP